MKGSIALVAVVVGVAASGQAADNKSDARFKLQYYPVTQGEAKEVKNGGAILDSDNLLVVLHGGTIHSFLQRMKASLMSGEPIGSQEKLLDSLKKVRVAKFPGTTQSVGASASTADFSNDQWSVKGLQGMLNELSGRSIGLSDDNDDGAPTALAEKAERAVRATLIADLEEQTRRLAKVGKASAKVNVTLRVLRDPNREFTANPLAFLLGADKAELDKVKNEAASSLEKLKEAERELKSIGKVIETKMKSLLEKADVLMTKVGGDSGAKEAVQRVIDQAKKVAQNAKADGLAYLIDSAMADLEILKANVDKVKNLDLSGDALSAKNDLLSTAKDEIESLALAKAVKAVVDALTVQVNEVERITKSAFISESGPSEVAFPNSGSSFGEQQLRPEDDVEVTVVAIDSKEKEFLIGRQSVVVMPSRPYFGKTIVPLGVLPNGSKKIEAGAGAFATMHFGGRGGRGDFKRNFGFSLGVAASAASSSGMGLMGGLGLWRDRVQIGFGRDFGANRNFFYIGIAGLKF